MKVSTVTPTLVALIAATAVTNAIPIRDASVEARDIQDSVMARELAMDFENLEARGQAKSSLNKAKTKLSAVKGFKDGAKKNPDVQAKFPVAGGNGKPPKPEEVVGASRKMTAGKGDDYFGNFQKLTEGVDNPAAGKGKASKPGTSTPPAPFPLKMPEGKGKKRSLEWEEELEARELDLDELDARDFDDFGELDARDYLDSDFEDLEARGPVQSKIKNAKTKLSAVKGFKDGAKKKDPDVQAKFPVAAGNGQPPKPEDPVGMSRKLNSGKKDDYFGDWQKFENVKNPMDGKGKKSTVPPSTPPTPFPLNMPEGKGQKRSLEWEEELEARELDLDELDARDFDDFGFGEIDARDYLDFDFEDLEARGQAKSSLNKAKTKLSAVGGFNKGAKKDTQAKFPVAAGNGKPPKSEDVVGVSRKMTAGKDDDYFGNYQKLTEGVNNPAAGKGKESKGSASTPPAPFPLKMPEGKGKKRSLEFDWEEY